MENKTKKVEIEIPVGKVAKWVEGVLTLVDENPQDITERIKTFEDALDELQVRAANGDNTAKMLYDDWHNVTTDSDDLIAYLQLRIIVSALNEGWEPQFTTDEYRYYPWFWFFKQEEYDEMDEDKKRRCVRSGYYSNAYCGLVSVGAYNGASHSSGYNGSRLAFRTRELAEYAGSQFIQEWADFVFKPRSCEGLNRKSDGDKSAL